MIYLKSIGAGIAGSILSIIALSVIVAVMNRNKQGMVGIMILAPLPLTIALFGFAAGFYLVFRNSR